MSHFNKFTDDELDELVSDRKAEEAAEINNQGRAAQLDYLFGDSAQFVPTVIGTQRALLRLNAPGWYKHPGFVAWLNSPCSATWHQKGKKRCGECCDAFFTYCDGDGSDSPGTDGSLPEEIWEALEAAIEKHYGTKQIELLVWVSNEAE